MAVVSLPVAHAVETVAVQKNANAPRVVNAKPALMAVAMGAVIAVESA